jgi:hypothetical protein
MGAVVKENIRVTFRANDPNYDWESGISGEPGYELINCQKIKNVTNSNWPEWSIVVDYKRNK